MFSLIVAVRDISFKQSGAFIQGSINAMIIAASMIWFTGLAEANALSAGAAWSPPMGNVMGPVSPTKPDHGWRIDPQGAEESRNFTTLRYEPPVSGQPIYASSMLDPGDENWSSRFGLAGFDDTVFALAIDTEGNLFAGGAFAVADDLPVNGVARWDGISWRDLGGGVAGAGAAVHALAIGPDGSLYVGGSFTSAGGLTANGIARWDGSRWHALQSGVNYEVYALAFGHDGSLYVGGYFNWAGGVVANHIARWDGGSWHPLGSGMGGSYPAVSSLAVAPNGSLYAGGHFTVAGGVAARHVARWDGISWHPLGDGVGSGGNDVHALAFASDGTLFVGGTFTEAGGTSASLVARWDGSSWYPLGTGIGSAGGITPFVLDLIVTPENELYVGGIFDRAGGEVAYNVARWDGALWHPLDNTSHLSGIRALALNREGHLLVGPTGVSPRGYVSLWDGATWQVVGNGGIPGNGDPWSTGVAAIVVSTDGSVYVGGDFGSAGGVAATNIARLSGTSWQALGNENTNGSVLALSAVEGEEIYVGGWFTLIGGTAAANVARWDGTNWHALGDGTSGRGENVTSLAVGGDGDLFVGGRFAFAGGVSANCIARWDGEGWHSLGAGMDSDVLSLAINEDGVLFAGGWFTRAGNTSAHHIARWDGNSWHSLGDGVNDSVIAMAIGPDGSLYAGGSFTMAGGVGADHVARWDGLSWHSLGSGLNGAVADLAFGSDGSLYAAGGFTMAGETATNHIARWDGERWHPLGTGLGGEQSFAAALAFDNRGSLFVGGYFLTAGNISSLSIAQWTSAVGQEISDLGSYTFYANNRPVKLDVVAQGDLSRIHVQRFNRSHPVGGPGLNTNYYWEIVGLNWLGAQAVGYRLHLTLPVADRPDGDEYVCRNDVLAWDCAAGIVDPVEYTVRRMNISNLSQWAVGDPDLGTVPPHVSVSLMPLVMIRTR